MLAGIIARARSLWAGLRSRHRVDAEMREEFQLHLELRAEHLVRQGFSPEAATRQARVEFGSSAHYADRGRESRGLERFDDLRVSALDFKLGVRMLGKYPAVTFIGAVAIAFAIAVGASSFEFIKQLAHPSLPFPDGERLVALRLWDANESHFENRIAFDFTLWRTRLRSVEEVGAYRTYDRNLNVGQGQGDPITVAEISSSAFTVTAVRPLLGRTLARADEELGAPPVALIGYDVWQSRFGGDTQVVGRTVRLGNAPYTIVGVMPRAFAFPINHSLWVPLRFDTRAYQPLDGPALSGVFGRLSEGATVSSANAELASLTAQLALASPATHGSLRAQIIPYAESFLKLSFSESTALWSVNLFLIGLLVLVAGNVALLMFARAAAREAEITVRSALGATRARIITQLCAESLVLAGLGAAIGLSVASRTLDWGLSEGFANAGPKLPFWITSHLDPTTIIYATALALIGALIAGVVPALKVTSGDTDARLRSLAAGGGGIKFGGVWTAVIVAQVAVTVAFPVTAFFAYREIAQLNEMDVGIATDQFLSAQIGYDVESPLGGDATNHTEQAAAFRSVYLELERRLRAEPRVIDMTFADRLPRMYHPHRLIEVDAGGAAPMNPEWPGYRVSSADVDPEFFDVVDSPVIVGRTFRADDAELDRHVVIVNRSFVHRVLGDRNPIGRRVRYRHFEERSSKDEPPSDWFEIIGVVRDMGTSTADDPKVSAIYHPLRLGSISPMRVAIHARGDPASLAPRLRAIAFVTDPALRVSDVVSLDRIDDAERGFLGFWFEILVGASALALLLSLAGIYAVMAFTVSKRTREIGVRAALGASPRRIITNLFKRPAAQVGAGILAGQFLTTLLVIGVYGGGLSLAQIALLAGYPVLMVGVCMLACIVPARRALRVEPTEALKADA